MKTLIELYDERPLENLLSTEVFRPERTVFVCPSDVAKNTALKRKMREYMAHRGVASKLSFVSASVLDAAQVASKLKEITHKYPECAIDIAGGTEAALFASGLLCADTDVSVFTYSRKRNTFFEIHNAPFARNLKNPVTLQVEDCFLMAGGSMRRGRVNNDVLNDYQKWYQPFFQIFLKHRTEWNKAVTYFQRVSQGEKDGEISLSVSGPMVVKGTYGSKIKAPESLLWDLEKLGLLRDVCIEEETVSFTFYDAQVRTWLRDVGSVLELYTYQACLDTGLFDDVRTSAVVDWQGDGKPDAVTNELDVMATRGVKPFFISCKVCDVKTEALNELAILRDRFGSGMARAAIVTAEKGKAIMRHRAEELEIDVIDLDDLRSGKIAERLKALTR